MKNRTQTAGKNEGRGATHVWVVLGVVGLLLAALLWTTLGCSDKAVTPVPEDLSGFINGISPFPPPAVEFDRAVGGVSDTTVSDNAGVMVCSVEKFEMGRNMDEIVAFNPNAPALWPGCIVQGKFVADGILVPVALPRNPCTVGIPDLPGMSQAELSRTVGSPDQFSVIGALNSIVDDFMGSGKQQAASFSFLEKETYSFEQGLLDIGVSASWPSGSLRSQFNYQWQGSKHTLLLKFTQKYYTATVVPGSSSGACFAPGVTVADLQQVTEDGNPLCYVSSITYGRLGILSMTSDSSESVMKASLHAAFDALLASGQIDAQAEYAKRLAESEMKLLILGGSGTSGVVSLTDPVQGLMSWINSGMKMSDSTRGVPIAYTVSYLKDNNPARFQYTTDFTRRTCAWADQPVYVSVYRLRCESDEGGAYPALEGWWNVWLYEEIPGLDSIVEHVGGAFADFDEGETRDITNASWRFDMPTQVGASFTLRISIYEDDDVYDDKLGDLSWKFSAPAFDIGTGVCTGDPKRCEFNQAFEYGGQRIRAYFRVNLDGNP